MFNKASVLDVSQKILGAESSERSGTVLFGKVLEKAFPSLSWKSLPAHGESTVYYVETKPEKKDIDLICYVNADTANPSQLSLWTETDFDPLLVTVKRGHIYGLGAAHDKVSLVAQLLALEEILKENTGLDKNILIAVGYGREFKMRGARRLLKEVVKQRKVHRVCVAHPTESKVLYGSAGRLKTKVFFPFSEKEKALRKEHDLKENTSSQSKVYSYIGGGELKDNTVFQMIESCRYLPKGTLILDLDGGAATITEPETTYFEVDSLPPFKDSMVLKFEHFGEKLLELDEDLKGKFKSGRLERAIHIGKCFDSDEGVTFFGFNLIPAYTSNQDLESWFEEFQKTVKTVGGEVMITDARSPYVNEERSGKEKEEHCLNVTEASVFSKICKDVVILGAGKEGLAKKPNESISIEDLMNTCYSYKSLFVEVLKG
ncbi:MAG: M20/M25/M40 family metallo-hydrolase [Bdellovibrionales bacterium]